MSQVLTRVRADLEQGRLWKARDRLAGALADTADQELLLLLGEMHFAMGDLPAAGAAWFATPRRGADVDAAAAAWRERHGNDPVRLWRSLPPTIRDSPAPAVLELFGQARQEADRRGSPEVSRSEPLPAVSDHSWYWLVIAFGALVLWFLALALVGAWTIIQYLLR